MNNLITFIDSWQPRRIVVLGDFMLDHYIYGNAERLSPDAPVPVLAVDREESRAGGAGNVALMLRALKCDVICVGCVGSDADADLLLNELNKADCNTENIIVANDRPTTVKRSFIGLAQHRHPQKMFRVDYEHKAPLEGENLQHLINAAKAALQNADALCIEDYNKGVLSKSTCQTIIAHAKQNHIPVLVDPAAIEDYSLYRGATTITPNRTEAALATGLPLNSDNEIKAAAQKLLTDLQLESVILTLDKLGSMLFQKDNPPQHFSTTARSVYDVTGAGDMVLAMLASALANNADLPTALQLANIAAGLEVEAFGVTPIPLETIHLEVIKTQNKTLGKVRTLDQLLPELQAHRTQGLKIAFTNGCFDILHAGHIETLRKARATADLLVLAVNTDTSISSFKDPSRPIIKQKDRLTLLSELECIDYIVLFGDGTGGDSDTPLHLIQQIKPDTLVKGGDYQIDQIVGHDIVIRNGGQVITIPLVAGLSTTHIVDKIKNATPASNKE